jgi:RNA polymerase sigma-70 factor (ECF subfamily)
MSSSQTNEGSEVTENERVDLPEKDQTSTPVLSEKEAIAGAKQGDALAFERLYQLHSARVYALCLRMTGNPAEAEDLTQDSFLIVFRKIGSFRGDSAFSTWLHRIAVNVALMRRRKKSSMETSLEENGGPGSDRPGPLESIAGNDLFLNGSIDRLQLERALEQLRPFHRLVVVLHDVQGYKHNEIAKMLDCTIGNSKSRLHRARARLRHLLKEKLRFPCIGIAPSGIAQAALHA